MTNEELIAALESAPEGTRELGVAVLEAVGAKRVEHRTRFVCWDWILDGVSVLYIGADYFDEARVVTDLNFRLPGVPEGAWWDNITQIYPGITRRPRWVALLATSDAKKTLFYRGDAHTEKLARCVAEVKAVLAVRDKP